uniref:Uncharacterized protein n=1 Tax=Theileria annulata TaxID=5874 RepID=A0A3B0MLN3_THEAN
MEFFLLLLVTLIYLSDFGECSGRLFSRSSGLLNSPMLTFPYLNVYYNFDPKDWSRIREQQSNARGKLFQTALSKNVLPIKTDKNEKNREPIRLYENVTNDIPHLNYLYHMN